MILQETKDSDLSLSAGGINLCHTVVNFPVLQTVLSKFVLVTGAISIFVSQCPCITNLG